MKIIFYVAVFLLTSCQDYSEPKQKIDYFFPVKEFLQKEKDMKSGKITVVKTVAYNGQSDVKTINNFSFSSDLQSFFDSDINKASLTDKYIGDTIIQQGQKVYEYNSLKENLKTKKVRITFENEKVKEIRILNNGTSVLRNFEEILVYQPEIGFEILFDQKLVRSDPSKANIIVKFQ